MEHGVIQHFHGNDGFRKRQHNAPEEAEMAAPIQRRGFIQVIGDGVLDERAGDDQVIGVDEHHHQQDPGRVDQAQVVDLHVGGHQAAGEIHGEHEIEHHLVTRFEIRPAQSIGRGHGDDHVEQRAAHHVKQGVAVAGQNTGVLENLLETVEADILGPEHHFAPVHHIGIADGRDDHEPQRIQNHDEAQDGQHQHSNVENAIGNVPLLDSVLIIDHGHFILVCHLAAPPYIRPEPVTRLLM